MQHGKDPRAEELKHLKVALTTFALQLDAFEMRARDILRKVRKPGHAASAVRDRPQRREDHALDNR